MEPENTLIVPENLNKINWLKEIKDWTQILANVAVAAGIALIGLQ
jgi:hypothetical protein